MIHSTCVNDFRFELARDLARQGELERAVQQVELLLRDNPYDTAAERFLCLLWWRLGEHGESIDRLAALVFACPDDPSTHRLLAILLIQDEQLAEGLPHLEQAALLGPEHRDTWLLLALVRFQLGDCDRAVASLQEGIQRDSRNADLHYLLALMQAAGGDVEQARKDFAAAAGLELIRPRACSHTEQTARLLEDVELVDVLLDLDPAVRSHPARAVLEAFTDRAEAFPCYPDMQYRLGRLRVEQGDLEQGFELFRRAATLNPAYADARSAMADCYEERAQNNGR